MSPGVAGGTGATRWALDLGTSKTALARWDPESARPRLVELPGICVKPAGSDPLEAPSLVPSVTQVRSAAEMGFWDRLGRRPFFLRRALLGRHATIGRPALELNETENLPGYVPTFKATLMRAPLKTLASRDGLQYSARDIAQHFLRELLRVVREETGERITALTLTAPVDAYETYRAELAGIARRLGIRDLRFVDEPVAAAVGYGVSLAGRRRVLVVDFGAGTLDLALVDLDARGVARGDSTVLAKAGRALGGNLVDEWLLEDFCRVLGYQLKADGPGDEPFWHRLMLAEARRVKEAVFFRPSETFAVTPPEDVACFEARIARRPGALRFDRERLVSILEERGMYGQVEGCLDEVLDQARAQGLGPDAIQDVLMVGGSTLLPDVYAIFERRFGRDRVRAWQPFEAVAYGACACAADAFTSSDYIVHDYAFVTWDPKTHEPEHTVVIPRGTRVPTRPDFWKRRLVPTCSLGEPERVFKLVICEIGRAENEGGRAFAWDAKGQLHKLGGTGGETSMVVALNEANPTLGSLDPPHPPADRQARLEISFGVDADRWLCAHVLDLRTGRVLMSEEPVVRLL